MSDEVTWETVEMMVPVGSLLRLPSASVENPSPVLDADDVRTIARTRIAKAETEPVSRVLLSSIETRMGEIARSNREWDLVVSLLVRLRGARLRMGGGGWTLTDSDNRNIHQDIDNLLQRIKALP